MESGRQLSMTDPRYLYQGLRSISVNDSNLPLQIGTFQAYIGAYWIHVFTDTTPEQASLNMISQLSIDAICLNHSD